MKCKISFSKFKGELNAADWLDVNQSFIKDQRNIDGDLVFSRNPEIESELQSLKETGVSIFFEVKL